MHGERHEFVPSEAHQEDIEDSGEIKDNVVEFPRQEKPAEHVVKHIFDKLSPHQKSLEILKAEGYNSLPHAEKGLADLLAEEAKIKMSFSAKIKDRLFNQGQEIKKLIELEERIHLLNRKLRIARITSDRERQDNELSPNKMPDNVVRMPEKIWPGPLEGPENPDDSEEIKKVA